MRNGTDRKRRGAIAAALAVAAVILLYIAAALTPLFSESGSELFPVVILGLYALLGLAVLAGVIAALVQRLRELRGGEEEDAKKY